MENLSYLFAAFAAVWLILFYYVTRMSRRQKQLSEEIEQIRKLLEDKSKNPR